jgi:phosphate transport system substrate-binding protein
MSLGLLAAALVASAALSEPVELRLRTGGMVVKGDLLNTDGNSAIISSPEFGVMMVEPKHFDCSGPGCTKLTPTSAFGIHGSNTIGEALTPALIQAYATQKQLRIEKRVGGSAEEVGFDFVEADGRKTAAIDLRSHGSGTSFPALANGAAEIGASSRPMKADEAKTLADAGLVPQAHVVALDGILVFVSPSNPIGELTLDQIAKIFAGEITDWAQLGRAPGEIKLYARDSKSGTYDTFNSLVLSPAKLKLSPKASLFESSVELSDGVARDANGIGFAGFAYLRNAKPLAIRSTCGITYRPTEFNVKTEEYALARRLFLYTTDKLRSPVAKSLLEYALSDAAQPIVADTGFIAQSIDYLSFGQQGDRFALALTAPPEDFDIGLLKEMAALLQNARRMSVTYRFEKNSGELELKAKQDVPRLARYLQSDEMKDKQIMLLGFADSTGPFAANRTVSLARAASLRDALVAAGGGQIDAAKILVKAYGEIMPVDCNNTEDGRTRNRRVEVWVKG